LSFLHVCVIAYFFFFFQAEDGIRDLIVTGVQTCALPILRPGPCRPGGVDGEAAEHECRKRRRHPPGIAPQRRADAALLQVSERRRHSFTAAMVCCTASADFWSAARSWGVSSTSRTCSSPLRPSLAGTPQYIPDSPYSPWSQTAHGRIRFLSPTIASTICTTAADGA